MEPFHVHAATIPRRWPSALPVSTIGHVPDKREFIHRSFGTFNFSFILAGSGSVRVDGVDEPVQAPCVLRQWPGEDMHYGPQGSWRELFIIYPQTVAPALAACGFIDPRRSWWPVRDATRMHDALDSLLGLVRSPDWERAIDRIDRAVEQMILESLLGAEPVVADLADRAVQAIRAHLRAHPQQDHDLAALAQAHGLSPSALRRRWQRLYEVPPWRFVIDCRLRRAARQLVETTATVGSIASANGFIDQLYFARCFRRFTGQSPTVYRQRYR